MVENKKLPLSAEMVIILQVLSEPSSLETALTMFGDAQRQFFKEEDIDPFISYRLTREEADRVNLTESQEDAAESTQSPMASDLAEAEGEIEAADLMDGIAPPEEDEVESIPEDIWDRPPERDPAEVQVADEDIEDREIRDEKLHLPKRFGKVWSAYANALEVFWARAEYCRPETQELYEGQAEKNKIVFQLLGNRPPALAGKTMNSPALFNLFKANLELVDSYLLDINQRTVDAIRNIGKPQA